MGWLKKTWKKVENKAKDIASNPIASAGIGLLLGGPFGGIAAGAASKHYADNMEEKAKERQERQKRAEEQKNSDEAEKRRRLLSEAYGNMYGLGRTQNLINTPFKTLLGE